MTAPLDDAAAAVADGAAHAVVVECNAFTAGRKRPGDKLGSVYPAAEAVLDVYTDPAVAASANSARSTPPVHRTEHAGRSQPPLTSRC